MKLKTLLFLLLAILGSTTLQAYDAVIDGIAYNLSFEEQTAEVTGNPDGYTGEVIIPDSVTYNGTNYRVTRIGGQSFCGCGVTAITIPNSVTSIGEYFLQFCGVTSIIIPKSVTSIEGPFLCSTLTSIIVEEGNAFYDSRDDCNAIIETKTNRLIQGGPNTIIPDDVACIGAEAFYGVDFTSITIPESVTSIEYRAFCECRSLTSITFPESLTYIGMQAFMGCTFTSITIPAGVTSIEGSFAGCTGLTSITIPEGVTSIGGSAFEGCSSLTSISIPESVTGIGERAFANCNCLRDIYCHAAEVPVTENEAFEGVNLSIARLLVPVESIEAYSTTEPWSGFGSIAATGEYEEYLCKHVNIDGIYYNFLRDEAEVSSKDGFYDELGNYRARSNNYSGDVVIPESVTYNGKTYNVTRIGIEAFGGCSRLTSVTIGNNVTDVGDRAFWADGRLTSVTFSNSVTKIGFALFNGCPRLTSVTIPKSVTSIAGRLFQDCDAMVSLNVEEGNPVYDSRDNCNAIIVTATNTLMTGIKTTVIPNSVTEIGGEAFYFCHGLTSISIPESVTEIGGSFCYCYDLKDVYCYAEQVPHTVAEAFDETNISEATLHVPATAVETYSTAEPWSNFGSIVGVSGHVLSYMVDGEEYKSYQLWEGQSIVPEQEPTKEGYTFSGWGEIPETMPAEDVTVTGSFSINSYILSYVVDGETYKTDSIVYGAEIIPEEAPTKEGMTFSGWSEIPETMPAHDVTVTGSFAVNACTIVFNTDGGSLIETISQDYGSEITPPDDPTREGYTFLGWEPAIPETMPQEGLIVVAQWQINSYTLVYVLDGEEYKTDTLEYNTPIIPEEEPTKEGYTFSGWSEIPDIMPAEDVTVTGSFIVNSYTLLYIIDEEEYKSYEIDYNTELAPEPEPTKKGMTFSGWSELPETMPANDVTVTGSFCWSTETLDGIVYEVADTLSNYASVIGYEGESEEAELLSEVEIGGDSYTVYSIAEDALPHTITIHTSVGKLLLWLWANGYEYIKEIETDRDLFAPEVALAQATASSLTLSFVNDYPEFSETVEVSGAPIEKGENGYSMKLTGLDPDYEYEGLASVTLTFEDASYTKTCSFRTEPLNLNTLLPKVISEGNVIVAAESNLDDDEANVGFKWRRTAWGDDEEIFPSRSGVAYLYEGMMEGIIRNLSSNPWKVRPFYTSNAGNTYYGAWRGIDPSDYSYFEPTVHTYAALAVTDSTAEVKGYAMQGTDNVESQGIMYWENTPSSSSRRKANGIPDDAKIVEVFSPVMKVTLSGLDYDTEYNFVAFVKTANGETFYGEQQSFRTTFDPDGIKDIEGEQQSIDNGQQIYDLSGRMIGKPQKGINIIRYSDGSTRKVVLK